MWLVEHMVCSSEFFGAVQTSEESYLSGIPSNSPFTFPPLVSLWVTPVLSDCKLLPPQTGSKAYFTPTLTQQASSALTDSLFYLSVVCLSLQLISCCCKSAGRDGSAVNLRAHIWWNSCKCFSLLSLFEATGSWADTDAAVGWNRLILKMLQRPRDLTLALCAALSERLQSPGFPALTVATDGVFGCWVIEEETPTAGHRWGCGSTGPDDQDRFNVVWAALHVVSVRAGFTEWLYGSDLGSSGCSDRIYCKYTVISCMWWAADCTARMISATISPFVPQQERKTEKRPERRNQKESARSNYCTSFVNIFLPPAASRP